MALQTPSPSQGDNELEASTTTPGGGYARDPGWQQLHQFAESLSNAIDAKDHCTRLHSQQVATLAHALALETGLAPDQAEAVHIAGHLHDIGKIGVPDNILKKAGPLTAEEWESVRRHPEIGAQIVRPVKALNGNSGIADMILHHHERWDGKGYPRGLAGTAIPLGARILAVADAFSAMVQDRPYRPGMNFSAAIGELRRAAGSQLDPEVVASCLTVLTASVAGCPLTRCPWHGRTPKELPEIQERLFPFCLEAAPNAENLHLPGAALICPRKI
jgi:HD-GYP domain-containing protein (c-di-GMP phosphodiesterase class II)